MDRENALWDLSGKKPRSPDRTLVKTDKDGTAWYKDTTGELFYLDSELLVPIYKGKKGFYRKADKEVRYAYDFLCRERQRYRYDGTPFISEFSAALLTYPIRPYYEDVDRLVGIKISRGCPSPKDAKKFESFLSDLKSVCASGCSSMAKGHIRSGYFAIEMYNQVREEALVAECRKVCGRTYTKEVNALQNYQAQNLLLFLEPVGAGKKGGFEVEEYK